MLISEYPGERQIPRVRVAGLERIHINILNYAITFSLQEQFIFASANRISLQFVFQGLNTLFISQCDRMGTTVGTTAWELQFQLQRLEFVFFILAGIL